MSAILGEYLSAQLEVLDGDGNGVTGLVPTTISSTDPLGLPFAATYTEEGGGAYFVITDLPSALAGNYTLFVDANDTVDPDGSQKFSITWDTDPAHAAVVYVGEQRVQYVLQPHEQFDPDGTWDSRYYTKEEGEDDLGTLVDDKANLTYVDDELALKADQTALDQLAIDLAAVLLDVTDMATETWVGTQIAPLATTSYVNSEITDLGGSTTSALAGKVGDFTQGYTATLVFGDGIAVIQSTEPAQMFEVPEAMTLTAIAYRTDTTGALTTNTSKAASGSASFTDIDGANPLAVSTPAVGVKTDLTGWTTSCNQFDTYMVNVPSNATSIKKATITFRFAKGRG